MPSVHDNLVYAQTTDYEACRLVLHAIYPQADPPEFTDIVFEGVIACHIERQAFHGKGVSANVLFDIAEGDAALTLGQYADLLTATENYGWPILEYHGLHDLTARLTAGGEKCFETHSSCGLGGFVFATSMEFRRRSSRAPVT